MLLSQQSIHKMAMLEIVRDFTRMALPPRVRTLRQFAEQEIIVPTGPHQGERLRCSVNPWTGLALDEMDRWPRTAATGPGQSGKTLIFFAVPTLYDLFELRYDVIIGLPSMDMAKDKWERDLLPVIALTRYNELRPTRGEGSRGGTIERSISFRNGATLRFMTAGGNDKKRAGYTAPRIRITEVDGFDEAGDTSRETNKVRQIEARANVFEDERRIGLECTVSYEKGRIWQEYTRGTASRIAQRCPHCLHYVTLGREDLIGWQDAEDVIAAAEASAFVCSQCGVVWSEFDRHRAAAASILLHRGQDVDHEGTIAAGKPIIIGDAPRTNTLGFRWSVADNLLISPGVIGAEEWEAQRSVTQEDEEKALCQFRWCIPIKPDQVDLLQIDPHAISQRTTNLAQGVMPDDTFKLTVGIDVGSWLIHYVVIAWRAGASGHVISYGAMDVPTRELGRDHAIISTLREIRDSLCRPGWRTVSGQQRSPDLVMVDAQWETETVHLFCSESGETFMAARGEGEAQHNAGKYHRPRQVNAAIAKIGEEFYIERVKGRAGGARARLVHVNVDHWKSFLHRRLTSPIGTPGALSLFNAPQQNHFGFAQQLSAEEQVEEAHPTKGTIIRWEKKSSKNHYLDASMLACVAGGVVGVKLLEVQPHQASSKTVNLSEWMKAKNKGGSNLIEARR